MERPFTTTKRRTMDAPFDRTVLAERARALLTEPGRIRIGERNGTQYRFIVPSLRFYYPPFQWFWDSLLQAIACCAIGLFDLAKDSIRSILAWERNDGFLPHVIFWRSAKGARSPWHLMYQETRGRLSFLPFARKPETTELIQPPLLAQAVARIVDATNDRAFLRETLPRINHYYRYLLSTRTGNDSLLVITSRFEGLDWSPAYDPAEGFRTPPRSGFPVWRRCWGTRLSNLWRFNYNAERIIAHGRFHVKDVVATSILALNLRELARLNAMAGRQCDAEWFDAQSVAVRDALIHKCYDEERGAFFNLTGRKEERFPILTIHSLFPLILPDLPRPIVETLVERHLTNPDEFWIGKDIRYPVPVVAAKEAERWCRYSRKPFSFLHFIFTWRWKQTWMNTNWYLEKGLRRHGFADLANIIVKQSHELVWRHGFFEYFDSETGEGGGAPDLGWSTLVVDME